MPEDHREAIDKICGAREGGFEDPAARTLAIRATAARGRMSGALEQITTVLTDPCLADCIEQLGDNSDNPSEDDLAEVTPGLIERHGLRDGAADARRVVAGEAAASVAADPAAQARRGARPARPSAEPAPAVVLTKEIDEETRARRKAAKERKQAEARLRREQQAKARNRV